VIEAHSLTKRYGDTIAIQDVSFEVEKGEVVGLLGPNGAGKTTAMKILTCFMPPTSGHAVICGHNIFDSPMEVKRSIGYLPEHPPVYPDLTVTAQLHFAAQLKEVPYRERARKVGLAMEKTGITHQAGRLVGNLSKGYQQRVGIAQALVHEPPVLILDEPTVGLDPSQIREIRSLIQDLGQAHTVILSTHILPEVSLTCEKIIIINQGRIAASGTVEEISRTVLGDDLLFARIKGPRAKLETALSELPGVASVKWQETPGEKGIQTMEILTNDDVDVREDLFGLCARETWPLYELRPPGMSLEEVFLRITSSDQEGV
jgi:ABC-2 type transport system ATP-binding protein